VHADPAEFAKDVAQAEYGDDRQGDSKDKTLKKSGHTHHRDGRRGKVGRTYPIDAMITKRGTRKQGRGAKWLRE
jgi:hypothetical protein